MRQTMKILLLCDMCMLKRHRKMWMLKRCDMFIKKMWMLKI